MTASRRRSGDCRAISRDALRRMAQLNHVEEKHHRIESLTSIPHERAESRVRRATAPNRGEPDADDEHRGRARDRPKAFADRGPDHGRSAGDKQITNIPATNLRRAPTNLSRFNRWIGAIRVHQFLVDQTGKQTPTVNHCALTRPHASVVVPSFFRPTEASSHSGGVVGLDPSMRGSVMRTHWLARLNVASTLKRSEIRGAATRERARAC